MSHTRFMMAVATTLLIGCSGQKQSSSTSGASATGASTAGTRPSASVGDSNNMDPGRIVSDSAVRPASGSLVATKSSAVLPKSLDYYLTNQKTVAEFRQFVLNHKWNGHERYRKCYDPKCKAGKARMVIEEVEGGDMIKFTDFQGGGQVLVGRMENTGSEEDVVFHGLIPPNQNALAVVLLVRGSGNKVYPKLVVTRYLNGVTITDTYIGGNEFRQCDGTHANGFEADFKPCPNKNPDLPWDNRQRVLDAAVDGAWFSCSEGCCGSSYPPIFNLVASKKFSGA